MPSLRMTLHNLLTHLPSIPINPPHQLIHILHLPLHQRMEPFPNPIPRNALLILTSHVLDRRQGSFAREDGRDSNSLELEEGESSREKRDADEDEGWIGYVEYILVQVVELCSIGDEYSIASLRSWCGVIMVLSQEGEGHVVSGAEYDAVDVCKYPTVFEDYLARYWLESSIQLCLFPFYRQTLECADLSGNAGGIRW